MALVALLVAALSCNVPQAMAQSNGTAEDAADIDLSTPEAIDALGSEPATEAPTEPATEAPPADFTEPPADAPVDAPAANETEPAAEAPVDAPIDAPAANETEPAANATAAEDAGEYNEGTDACIYADHPTSLLETASGAPDFSTLVAAVNASGLAPVLDDNTAKVTVFAPTNAAFQKFFDNFNVTAEEILGNKEFLTTVLKYHVLPTVVGFKDLTNGEELATALEGASLKVEKDQVSTTATAFGVPVGTQVSDAVTIVADSSSAMIARGNLWTCNGVIQVIDYVLVPQQAVEASN